MDLAFLNPLFTRPGPYASVYVDTSRHSESTADERSLEAFAAYRSLASQGADEPTCHAVHAAMEELRHSSEPNGRALFAAGGDVVLDPPLTSPPSGTRVHFGVLPHVAPLLELADDSPVCLVAYVDRRGADFELHGGHGTHAAGGATGRRQWPVHRTATADWSERHFQNKVENAWEHTAQDIAAALAACQEETRAGLVVLVGDPRERRAVHDRLPEQVRARTVESQRGSRATGGTGRLLDEEVERLRAEHARQWADDELESFTAALDKDGGAAAEGVPALVEAAREHRIAELLMRPAGPDAHRTVWVGDEPDQLSVRRSDSRYLGAPNPEAARADDALLRSASATGAEAVAVHSRSTPHGGLGALLRWS
ncbi:Vms1/Ankzf1 family peptidyl-tRNA hydrolase [Streptomyces monticola]|uniref:Vms1/Ankzf1 family peptidyl-tRNA hydrolase n=1 Tax=Streptomyces monticola TaxID=2666263 RepID=A0ABW2JC00_9ACTN